MKINLKEYEIQNAIYQYLESKGLTLFDRTVFITFRAGRKGNGLSTEVTISGEDQKLPEKTVTEFIGNAPQAPEVPQAPIAVVLTPSMPKPTEEPPWADPEEDEEETEPEPQPAIQNLEKAKTLSLFS